MSRCEKCGAEFEPVTRIELVGDLPGEPKKSLGGFKLSGSALRQCSACLPLWEIAQNAELRGTLFGLMGSQNVPWNRVRLRYADDRVAASYILEEYMRHVPRSEWPENQKEDEK